MASVSNVLSTLLAVHGCATCVGLYVKSIRMLCSFSTRILFQKLEPRIGPVEIDGGRNATVLHLSVRRRKGKILPHNVYTVQHL